MKWMQTETPNSTPSAMHHTRAKSKEGTSARSTHVQRQLSCPGPDGRASNRQRGQRQQPTQAQHNLKHNTIHYKISRPSQRRSFKVPEKNATYIPYLTIPFIHMCAQQKHSPSNSPSARRNIHQPRWRAPTQDRPPPTMRKSVST
jgi:hypothetical protein